MRTYTPAPDHCFLVSFPKSGNTWMRFLLANYLADRDEPITFAEVGSIVPDLHRQQDLPTLVEPGSPFNAAAGHFVKSHSTAIAGLPNVVYLVRDGRDAITSYYHWAAARSEQPPRVADLVQGRGIHSGLWAYHVLGWLHQPNQRLLLIRYRDLLADPAAGLTQTLEFAGLEADPQRVERAVERSAFDTMQSLEMEQGLFDGPSEATRKTPFVRKGSIGDWRNLFTESDHALFWQVHGRAMREAGYEDAFAAAG